MFIFFPAGDGATKNAEQKMGSILEFDVEKVIVDSITEVFDMMLSMTVQYGGGTFREEAVKSVLGSINIMGDVIGIVNISVKEPFSREMVGSMLDMDADQIEGTEEIQDVLGEICNMVAGSLKSGLCDAGMGCELSTPAVITGSDYNHEARDMSRHEHFTFWHDGNAVAVDVGLKAVDGDFIRDQQNLTISPETSDGNIFEYDMKGSVIHSVAEVFDTMLSMEVIYNEMGHGNALAANRIVGSISLSGNVLGRVNLHIPETFARDVTSFMLGTAPEDIEGLDEVKDVVGELCNMISGALKSDLCDAGLVCRVSPPSFTTGSDFEMECLHLVRHESFLFVHGDELFMVEVGLRPHDG
jgi:CheY-specific phosphatase CheX